MQHGHFPWIFTAIVEVGKEGFTDFELDLHLFGFLHTWSLDDPLN